MSAHDREPRPRRSVGLRPASQKWLRRGVNVLNGFVGDHLEARENPLAIEMAFLHRGRPVQLVPGKMPEAFSGSASRLCILVHGLGCDESVWQFPAGAPEGSDDSEVSYGTLLATDLGFTSLFLKYNTGLSIEENGVRLARLLGELVECAPASLREIVLLGHSMGGVVIRSACQTAAATGETWPLKLRTTITLGAPLDGADLARVAHLTSALLRVPAHPITGLIGDVFDIRSRGIKDLAFGWRELSLPPGARHLEIFGALNRSRSHLATRLFGDGLVRGPHARAGTENVKHFPGVGHLELASSRDVYRQIREWCRP